MWTGELDHTGLGIWTGYFSVWVKEKADELARTGSLSIANEPDLFIPIPQLLCDKAVRDWIKSEFAKYWAAYGGGTALKKTFSSSNTIQLMQELVKIIKIKKIRENISCIIGSWRGANDNWTNKLLSIENSQSDNRQLWTRQAPT